MLSETNRQWRLADYKSHQQGVVSDFHIQIGLILMVLVVVVGGGVDGGGGGSPYEAVLPEDVEELPGE